MLQSQLVWTDAENQGGEKSLVHRIKEKKKWKNTLDTEAVHLIHHPEKKGNTSVSKTTATEDDHHAPQVFKAMPIR